MSNYTYSSSSSKRPIIHSGGSSSRDSTYHESQSGRYSSANSSVSMEESREHRYRVPDNGLSHLTHSQHHTSSNSLFTDSKYITGKRSKDDRVEVFNHRQSIYEPDAPRSSDRPSRESRDSRESKSRSSKDKSSSKVHRSK